MILKKFTIHTQYSIAEARDKLTCQFDNKVSPFEFRFARDTLDGEVNENTFWLVRRQGGQQSPILIKGWFEAAKIGTIVHLAAELNSILTIVVFGILLQLAWSEWQQGAKLTHGYLGLYIIITIITLGIVSFIITSQKDLRFYPKKLAQIFS
jgi:hypothetical protein